MGTAYPSLRWLRAAGFVPAVAGSPQECIDQLAMYGRDYGVDYVSIRFCLPAGPEHKRVPDCIRLFGEEVFAAVSQIEVLSEAQYSEQKL